jgi:hypothetical protein
MLSSRSNESKSSGSSSSPSSSSSPPSSSENEENVSAYSSSSDSNNEHLSEEDTDPDVDPDGDIEFGPDNPNAAVITNDQWIRDRIRNKRRQERAERKRLRLQKKDLIKLKKQRKRGLIKDIRPRDIVLRETLRELFNDTGGAGVWNETRGWDGKTDKLSLFHGVVVNRDVDSGEYDVNPLCLLSLTLQSNGLVGHFRKNFKNFFMTNGKYMSVLNLSRNELNYSKGIPKEIFLLKHLNTLLLENTGGKGYVFGGTVEDNQEDVDDAEEDEDEEDEDQLSKNKMTTEKREMKTKIENDRKKKVEEEEELELAKNKYRLPSLQIFSIANNNFKGCIKKILHISNQLRVLNISNNEFDGEYRGRGSHVFDSICLTFLFLLFFQEQYHQNG